jgi:hypothetical protein
MGFVARAAVVTGHGLYGRCSGVRGLWLPNFSDGGNDFLGHPNAAVSLVPRHVVGDHAEEQCQGVGTATSARPEEI